MKSYKKILSFAALLFFMAVPLSPAGAQQAGAAKADDYPNKPIRLILGVAPGGSMETAARMWQPYLEKELGAPIYIDCIPGAEGMIGGKVAAESAPDGYTLIQMPPAFLSAQVLVLDAPYKYEAFEMLVNYIKDPMAFMVHEDSQWKTLRELVDYAKSQPPESVSVGLTNLTTADNIILHNIEAKEGIKFNLVPFTGGNPARMALAGRHIDFMVPSFFGSQSIWEYVRVLAVAQDKNLWPDLTNNAPTASDALGYPLPAVSDNISIWAPTGFSKQYPERYKKFMDAFYKATSHPDYIANLEKTGQIGRFRVLNPEESKKIQEDEFMMYKTNIELFKK